MSEYIYTFTKAVNRELLEQELRANVYLITGVYGVTVENDTTVKVYMKAALDSAQQLVLAAAVDAHINVPLDPVAARPPLMTLIENERILEEGIELTYRMYPVLFDIPASTNGGEPYSFPVVIPCTIATLGATVDLSAAMIGDSMAFDAPSETIIGHLSAEVTTGTNIGYINETARPYMYKGMDIIINDTVQGRIFGWEGDYGFKLHENFKGSYPVGTQVSVRFRTVDRYLVTAAPLQLWISRDTDRAAIVPRNTPQMFHYWNDTGTAKKVQICFEFYT